MHRARFNPYDRLSDWPNCHIEVRCPRCDKMVLYPVAMMQAEFGDRTFLDLVPRLSCSVCNVRAAPVYLCASHHRTFNGGPAPDWAVELVPPPKAR